MEVKNKKVIYEINNTHHIISGECIKEKIKVKKKK